MYCRHYLPALAILLGWSQAIQAQIQPAASANPPAATPPTPAPPPWQAVVTKALDKAGLSQDTTALNDLYENMEPATQIAPGLLGVGASSVSTPGGIQDISLTQLQSFTKFPNQGDGIGIEFSPVQLWRKTRLDKIDLSSLTTSLTKLGIPFDEKALQAALLKRDYVSLRAYRKNFWKQGFTISGASTTDSLASRLAAGISYTFGAAQLDPYTAKGFAESVSQAAGLLLTDQLAAKSTGAPAGLNGVLNDILNQNTTIIASALKKAGLTSCSACAYSVVRDILLDQVLAAPSISSPLSSADTVRILSLVDADQLEARFRAGLETAAEASPNRVKDLTEAQISAILEVITKEYALPIKAVYKTYFAATVPVFRSLTALIKTKTDEFERKNWNASLIQLGVGSVWNSPKHTWDNISYQSTHVFLRASGRLGSSNTWANQHVQFVMNLQYAHHNIDSPQDKVWYGGRVLLGNQRFRFSTEASWQWQNYRTLNGITPASDTRQRFTVGAEMRVADNLWLEIAFGRIYPVPVMENGKANPQSGLLTLADLKYGFRNRRRFVAH